MPLIWTKGKGGDLPYQDDPAKLLRATAFHEAGHAVVGYRFGKWIRDPGISVARDRPGDGHTAIRGQILLPLSQAPDLRVAHSWRKLVRTECMEFLAGYQAEAREMRVRGLLGGGYDWERSVELVRTVYEYDETLAQVMLIVDFVPTVRKLLGDAAVWKTVGTLAETLIDRGSLSGEAAQDLLEKSDVRPVPMTYWRSSRVSVLATTANAIKSDECS